MEPLHWNLHPSVEGRVRARTLEVHGAVCRDTGRAFAQLAELGRRLGLLHADTPIGQVEGIAEARRLYKSFGVDPTRTRPSSEALLRRCRKGQDLYRINEIVDVGNWVSLEFLLPLGLYDRDRVVGDTLTVRVGHEGEEYEGIRKGPVHLGGRLCVADAEGAMGSPTSDSLRTSIRPETTSIAAIVFSPADGDRARLDAAADALAARLLEFAGGELVAQALLGD